MAVAVRPFRPSDRPAVDALSPRLREGIAAWRDPQGVQRAVSSWVDPAVRDVDDDRPVWVAVSEDAVAGFVAAEVSAH